MRFSHSSIQTWQTCQRKYDNQYNKGIRPRKRPVPYIVGSAVGKFLEAYYQQQPNPLLALEAEFKNVNTSLLSTEEVADLACQRAMCVGIAKAYPKFYDQDFDQFQKFICEKRGMLKLKNGHEYEGYIDVLCQDAAGDWWIMETKTASRVDSNYLDRVKIDWQVISYMWLAKEMLGSFPRGVVYNVIKKTQIRRKAGEALSTFAKRIETEYVLHAQAKGLFHREEVIIGRDALIQWRREIEYVTALIASKEEGTPWPMSTGACIQAYGACQYLNLCTSAEMNKLIYEVSKGGK